MISRMNQILDGGMVSFGGLSLSYTNIFNTITDILKTKSKDLVIALKHDKAAKLLYISNGIYVKDHRFGHFSLGELEILVVYDRLNPSLSDYLYDVAQLDNKNILFLFYDNIISETTTISELFAHVYSIYNLLVAMQVSPHLVVAYGSIYSSIARYAALVLTVKSLLELGINISIDEIDTNSIAPDDIYLVTEEILSQIKSIDIGDLLTYGALCEYVEK